MRVRAEGSLVGLLGERPATGRAGHPYARLAVEVVARGRRGSGYLVGEDTVLTAAQPVRRAALILIRLDAGLPAQREAPAAVVWLDVDADLAVLRLTPGAGPVPPSPVRYGRMTSRPGSLELATTPDPLIGGPLIGPVISTVIGASHDTLDIAAEAPPGTVAFTGGLAVGVVTARDPFAVARLDHHLGHARPGRRLAALLQAGPLVDVACTP